MSIISSYLSAIQTIPGDTPTEKYKWISKFYFNRVQASGELIDVFQSGEFPNAFRSLIDLETAKELKKYEGITEALKSDDFLVVSRALKVTWFFDGQNKNYTNVKYFREKLFPYVSVRTRKCIIKMLAIGLSSKKEFSLAEEFFVTLKSMYGLKSVLRLLQACSESFIYDTIVEEKIILPCYIIKIMFQKNPNLTIRYLKLSNPNDNSREHLYNQIKITYYIDTLVKLVKKHLEEFIEIFEMHEKHPPNLKLSESSSRLFLKNGKKYLLAKPKLYIEILPLKLINDTCMEIILPKLLPEDINKFQIHDMLDYLSYYPRSKRAWLLIKSYKEIYGKNLLDNRKNITPRLLEILSPEERTAQAIMMSKNIDDIVTYEEAWWCYIPVNESVPLIKNAILKAEEMNHRINLLCQWVYTCKINKDDNALLQMLHFFNERHKNEQSCCFTSVLRTLINLYNIFNLSEDHWNVLNDIIERGYITNNFHSNILLQIAILEAAICYKLKNKLPIDTYIKIFFTVKISNGYSDLNLRSTYSKEFIRMCLDACINCAENMYNSNEKEWNNNKFNILRALLQSIYNFNRKYIKQSTSTQSLSINMYPWLLDATQLLICETPDKSNEYVVNIIKKLLNKEEPQLCESWVGKKKTVDIQNALQLLRKDPRSVLENWEAYFQQCYDNYHTKDSIRFIKKLHWYQDIPIKFMNCFLDKVNKEKDHISLYLLAFLLDGNAYATIIEPFLPTESTININDENAKSNYDILHSALKGINVVWPPVPLKVIEKLCKGDYMKLALIVLTKLSKRISVQKVVSFAKNLTTKQVSVKKHGIRIICMIESVEQVSEFLMSLWISETHHSIRRVLYTEMLNLFHKEPSPTTLFLFQNYITTLKANDWSMFQFLTNLQNVPILYIVDYIKLILKAANNFVKQDIKERTVNEFINRLLNNINDFCWEKIPDELCEEILKRFFKNVMYQNHYTTNFIFSAFINVSNDKLDSRLTVFSRVFSDVLENYWNVPSDTQVQYYPMNYFLHTLTNDIIGYPLYTNTTLIRIIDTMLNIFDKILKPQMNARPFLLLNFAKMWTDSRTAQEFGRKIVQKVPELVETFSPLFLSYIANTLSYFISANNMKIIIKSDKIEVTLDVFESLTEFESLYPYLLAVNMLKSIRSSVHVDKYEQLIKKFCEYDHPSVTSTLYSFRNSQNFELCIFENEL